MSQLKELSFADLGPEIASTRRVLDRIPDDKLGWKPHEKSNSLGELAAHIVTIMGLQVTVLSTSELDFAAAPPPPPSAGSGSALVEAFDAHAARLKEALEAADEATLGENWTLRVGERVIFTRPKAVVLRSFGLSHIAHHRGQLTVYLRLLDVPLPPVYGPTADES